MSVIRQCGWPRTPAVIHNNCDESAHLIDYRNLISGEGSPMNGGLSTLCETPQLGETT